MSRCRCFFFLLTLCVILSLLEVNGHRRRNGLVLRKEKFAERRRVSNRLKFRRTRYKLRVAKRKRLRVRRVPAPKWNGGYAGTSGGLSTSCRFEVTPTCFQFCYASNCKNVCYYPVTERCLTKK